MIKEITQRFQAKGYSVYLLPGQIWLFKNGGAWCLEIKQMILDYKNGNFNWEINGLCDPIEAINIEEIEQA